jgi:AcrR family transcriptional regulator
MLEEGTFDDATIPLVVRKAESSVGSFYSLFKNKDALFECLMDRHEDRVLRLVREFVKDRRWRKASLTQRTEAWVHLLITYFRRERGVMRARILRNIKCPKSVPEYRKRRIRRLLGEVRGFFGQNLHEAWHPKPQEALNIALMTLDYVASYKILLEDPRDRLFGNVSDRQLKRQLTRLFLSYLGVFDGERHSAPLSQP